MARIRQRLEQSLILVDDYLHPLFGADGSDKDGPFRSLQKKLGDFPDGYDSSGRSYLVQRLKQNMYHGEPAALDGYDDNIRRHLAAINEKRPQDEQITLKYFQLLALLYTEHVLDRIFSDGAAFVDDLNQLVAARNEQSRRDTFALFSESDLNKLAYWMATGSGKTLLMHVNYHQLLHYQAQSKTRPFENILLITPNAGLTQQHLRELRWSGIPARPFRQSMTSVLSGTVQVIEITKFTEGSSGPQTVNIDSFEGRNLVFVDEGHRGASGDVWFGYREKLAAEGFTFEYSATFGEAFNSGNKASDIAMRQAYGRAIVFDYSYRYFHGDGYGKDYTILNLPRSYHDNNRDTLLLANLMTLFEQTWVYQEHEQEMRHYHIERPLLMFVGHTVQTGKTRSSLTKADKESLSDVLDIVRFLHQVTNDRGWTIETAGRILSQQSNLSNENGVDIFHNKFPLLKGHFTPESLYQALLADIFRAETGGPLHLSNVRNAPGEISLRVGSSDVPFGVINIGDDSNFLNMAERQNLGLFIDEDDALRSSLFNTINHSQSTINILVGAKKFTEGWSSWRVSGMGLLNVGRSEGSEVIQMFGRGVRLKGYHHSLKRSAVLDGSHPLHLPLLETLNIFSVNGDYLAQFKEALGREGIVEGYEELYLPVRFDTFENEQPQLYIIRNREDRDFADEPTFALTAVDIPRIKPALDLRPRVQVATSQQASAVLHGERQETGIRKPYLNWLNWDEIYLEMVAWRRERGFKNMAITREGLRQIMEPVEAHGEIRGVYYTLYATDELTAPRSFADMPRLQGVVLSILKQYAERFYNYQRDVWENQNREYRLLDRHDANMQIAELPLNPPRPGYIVKVNLRKPELIDEIESLIQQGDEIYQRDLENFPNVVFGRHLYTPLMVDNSDYEIEEGDIKSVPTSLNKGEKRFVLSLRDVLQNGAASRLGGRKLYLLRNLSKGRGVGFFETVNFYPDFILWLVDGNEQKVTFVDPKGLALLKPNTLEHPKIQLFRTLQNEIGPQIHNPDNAIITLDSYVISAQSYTETIKYFGDPNRPYLPEQFDEAHVLFPGTAATQLLGRLL